MVIYMVFEGCNVGNFGYGNVVVVVLFLILFVVVLIY